MQPCRQDLLGFQYTEAETEKEGKWLHLPYGKVESRIFIPFSAMSPEVAAFAVRHHADEINVLAPCFLQQPGLLVLMAVGLSVCLGAQRRGWQELLLYQETRDNACFS